MPVASTAPAGRTSLQLVRLAVLLGFLGLICHAVTPVSATCSTISNCVDCSASPNTCTMCASGYMPDTSTGLCLYMDCSIVNCTKCNTPDSCAACIDGSKLTEALTCEWVTCTTPDCSVCSGENSSVCLTCSNGMAPEFPGGQCNAPPVPCQLTNCTKCVDGTGWACEICEAGTSLTADRTCTVGGDGDILLHSVVGVAVAAVVALLAAVY